VDTARLEAKNVRLEQSLRSTEALVANSDDQHCHGKKKASRADVAQRFPLTYNSFFSLVVGQNGSTDPDGVLALGGSDDLDLHGRRSKSSDLLLHSKDLYGNIVMVRKKPPELMLRKDPH
jgi:hypothetical protein